MDLSLSSPPPPANETTRAPPPPRLTPTTPASFPCFHFSHGNTASHAGREASLACPAAHGGAPQGAACMPVAPALCCRRAGAHNTFSPSKPIHTNTAAAFGLRAAPPPPRTPAPFRAT
eukprot:68874-Chlamydomonas_euryale.AAC.2